MFITSKLLLSIMGTLGAIALFLGGLNVQTKPNPALGSVSVSNEYNATSTKNAFTGSSTIPNYYALKTVGGSLGSVIITGANTGTINLYDATTTIPNTAWATTTLVSIPASTAAGTYTFDINF